MQGERKARYYNDQELHAAFSQAEQWSVRLQDPEDPTGGGSATQVRLGDRYFLATARHVIEKAPRIELVRPRDQPKLSDFINAAWQPGEQAYADVGLLELPPNLAKTLGAFATKANILPGFDSKQEWDVIVSGFPGASHYQSPLGTAFVGTTFYQATVPKKAWPTEPVREPDPKNDIFVSYPKDMRAQMRASGSPFDSSASEPIKAPHPRGLSGCGIWLVGEATVGNAKVWRPHLQLIGLQNTNFKRLPLLRGTVIDMWLDLVRHQYPDLKSEIDSIESNGFDKIRQ